MEAASTRPRQRACEGQGARLRAAEKNGQLVDHRLLIQTSLLVAYGHKLADRLHDLARLVRLKGVNLVGLSRGSEEQKKKKKKKKKKMGIRQLRCRRWLWQERTVIETVKSTLPTRMASGPQPSWISSMVTSYSAFLAPTMHHTHPFPPIFPAGGILTGLARKSRLPTAFVKPQHNKDGTP